jgi:hypothetical protein
VDYPVEMYIGLQSFYKFIHIMYMSVSYVNWRKMLSEFFGSYIIYQNSPSVPGSVTIRFLSLVRFEERVQK